MYVYLIQLLYSKVWVIYRFQRHLVNTYHTLFIVSLCTVCLGWGLEEEPTNEFKGHWIVAEMSLYSHLLVLVTSVVRDAIHLLSVVRTR